MTDPILSNEEKQDRIARNWRLEDVDEVPFLIEIGSFHASTSEYHYRPRGRARLERRLPPPARGRLRLRHAEHQAQPGHQHRGRGLRLRVHGERRGRPLGQAPDPRRQRAGRARPAGPRPADQPRLPAGLGAGRLSPVPLRAAAAARQRPLPARDGLAHLGVHLVHHRDPAPPPRGARADGKGHGGDDRLPARAARTHPQPPHDGARDVAHPARGRRARERRHGGRHVAEPLPGVRGAVQRHDIAGAGRESSYTPAGRSKTWWRR